MPWRCARKPLTLCFTGNGTELGSSDERWTADLRRGLFGLGQILSSMCRGLKEFHQGCAHEMPSFLSWLSTGSVLSTC
jgi:hypothetical protein